ncbi:site-specific integrase [Bosea sp. RAF48]|uniref:site-specific integrase n=1 Tax=Bosea sp. RAF48 TaxID=3237480 RepID=UPI003F8DE94F
MLTLSSTPQPLSVLARYESGFTEQLAQFGYGRTRTLVLRRLFRAFDQWLGSHNLQVEHLSLRAIDSFLDDRRKAGEKVAICRRAIKPIVDYLGNNDAALQEEIENPSGRDRVVDLFQQYLAMERNVTVAVTRQYAARIRPFVKAHLSVSSDRTLGVKALTEADVIRYVVDVCPKLTKAGAALFVTALRSFLRFLHLAGYIDRPMCSAVPSVSGRRLTAMPKAIEPDVLQRLLASCDRNTLIGSRRFAILTMLSRLGLRAGEVANLQLGDINWRAGEIVVAHAKGNRTEALPLPPDVGSPLADYITRWRPRNAIGRNVFVRVQAPHGPLTSGAVTQLVAHAAESCGLGRIHAHRLRHTAATSMLRGGASLAEVGQVLRHRQMITTAIYAKADREALRSIARPWPEELA